MPDKAPLPALPMPRGVLHASMISASTMVFSFLLLCCICRRPSRKVNLVNEFVTRMSEAISGAFLCIRPGCRCAHPGYMITSLASPQRQYLLRRPQVRLIDHLAVDLHHT